MIEIKYIGRFETLPPIMEAIINEDELGLKQYFETHDINDGIEVGKYTSLTPLDISLITNKIISIKWIIEHGADLNVKGNPSFLLAVRYCDEEVIRYVVNRGANVNLLNHVKSDAFQAALYGKKFENLTLIEELGHKSSEYGGQAFRSAVSDKNYLVTDFFIKHGVDINYIRPDNVYTFEPTPLCVAARYADLDMVKYLVENGADLTLNERDGMRPYNIALEKGDLKMAEYLKSVEPKELHSLQNKLDNLKEYNLPDSLISFLQGSNLHFDLGKDSASEYIKFFNIVDTVEFKFRDKKLLRISRDVENYSGAIICWNPESKCIAGYDPEHQNVADICSFDDFTKELSVYLNNWLRGDYDEYEDYDD